MAKVCLWPVSFSLLLGQIDKESLRKEITTLAQNSKAQSVVVRRLARFHPRSRSKERETLGLTLLSTFYLQGPWNVACVPWHYPHEERVFLSQRKHPHRHTKRCVSMMILKPIRQTMKINHCNNTVCQFTTHSSCQVTDYFSFLHLISLVCWLCQGYNLESQHVRQESQHQVTPLSFIFTIFKLLLTLYHFLCHKRYTQTFKCIIK